MAVEGLIKKGERALEEENLEEGFKYISKDYQDNWGNDYKGLYQKTVQFFNDFDNLEIIILKKKKEFSGGGMSPRLRQGSASIMTKKCIIRLWLLLDADFPHIGPGRGQEYMKMELKKEKDKKWRVISTTFGEKW